MAYDALIFPTKIFNTKEILWLVLNGKKAENLNQRKQMQTSILANWI